MKVLFAVSNDNVSNSIIKKYQEKYKEIITSKNVYYFNAITKELQKDKSYDVVVIGEDLEPISTNNYDTIDKFIFDKLDNISDEAYKPTGEDIPIILICSDRRTKSDGLLVKLFGIGVYNALLGNDRNIEAVCNLLNKPRSKKEAKNYYKLDTEDVNYRPESDEEVSETEIQNILNHYKKIGSNEKKCVQSFDSIASQYTDTQLRIITKFLPLNVKAILEANSIRYQQLMTGGTVLSNGKYNKYEAPTSKNIKKQSMDLLTKDLEKTKLTKPVVIPSTMNIEPISNQQSVPTKNVYEQSTNTETRNIYQQPVSMSLPNNYEKNDNIAPSNVINSVAEQPKRRGRPKKVVQEETKPIEQVEQVPVKRGRGRPKKVVEPVQEEIKSQEMQEQNINLFDLDNEFSNSNNLDNENVAINNIQKNTVEPTTNSDTINLFEMANDERTSYNPYINQIQYEPETIQSNTNEYMQDDNLQSNMNEYMQDDNLQSNMNGYMQDDNLQSNMNGYMQNDNLQSNTNEYMQEENPQYNMNGYMQDSRTQTTVNPYDNVYNNRNFMESQELENTNYANNIENSNFIAKNSKFVAFVGTSKNGTSFIVNNLAELLSQKGINTAILDLTKNKNSYYMFTDNDQNLMKTAGDSIRNLAIGNALGVQVNKNLTVFTSLPGDDRELENVDNILQTLDNSYSAVLMDCDFDTNINYFIKSTEIYLVQSMDALTIQPLTLFLSELKLKNALDESKLRVIINKEIKLKILTDKMILGGMAKYNEPSMTLQRELFNPNLIKYVTIPFEMQTYARYLEAIALCQISLSGYSQVFMNSLENLANMVYPLIPGGRTQNYSNYAPDYEKANKKGWFGSKNKKQVQTQFSSHVNGTLNKMRSNY